MPSIFEAATLAVYNLPLPATQAASNLIAFLRKDHPQIIAGFDISPIEQVADAVHITLPIDKHEDDPNLWMHLEELRQAICSIPELDCHWAASNKRDRSRAVVYEIRLVPPSGDISKAAREAKLGRFSKEDLSLRRDNPFLDQEHFRLKIVNAALDRLEIPHVTNEWYPSRRCTVKGTAVSQVTLRSPRDVQKCIATKLQEPVWIDGSPFHVHFDHVYGLITPTTCTTIGMFVRPDKVEETGCHLLELLDNYNSANGREGFWKATIDNIRLGDQRPKWLLCDPCDIVTARALCELPMPNGGFLRQVFFANSDPANYFKENAKAYAEQAMAEYEGEMMHTYGKVPSYSGSTEALMVDIDSEGPRRTKQESSELQQARFMRKMDVYRWNQDQEEAKRMSAARLISVFHDWNTKVAKLTPVGFEHSFSPDQSLIEDTDALTSQIEVYNELRESGRDPRGEKLWMSDWAQSRLDVITRIRRRIELRESIRDAKLTMTSKAFRSLTYRTTSVVGTGDDTKKRDKREELEAMEERARKDLDKFEAELAESMANDPAYEPPESYAPPDSATRSLTSSTSTNTSSSTYLTSTSHQASSSLMSGMKRKDPPTVTDPAVMAKIRSLEMNIKAKTATMKYFPPGGSTGGLHDQYQREIAKLQGDLHKLRNGEI